MQEKQIKNDKLGNIYKELINIVNGYPDRSPNDVLRNIEFAPSYSMEKFESTIEILNIQIEDYKRQLNFEHLKRERRYDIENQISLKTGHILTEDNSENRFTSRYMDIPNTPLYPFGYGLSYTEFDISDIDVQIGQDKKVHVYCNVCNTGNVAGAEVVQCYYETLYASVVRPKKELIRFRKVFLEPGEKKDVDFFIDQEEFSYYGKNMETVSSGMKLRINIGNSSDHLVSENIIQE